MIIDIRKFIADEQKYWEELESVLDRLEKSADVLMDLDEVRNFHYLYERVSSDLTKINIISSEPETKGYLEKLVARAYGEIHETRDKPHRLRPLEWFFRTLPRTFRMHIRAFYLAVAVTMCGCLLGGLIIALDPEAKAIILPFEHLIGSPAERVANEEKLLQDRLSGSKAQGAAWYMTHNTKVSISTMVMGVTWGIGTIILLFYNGIMLGAVVLDYVLAGESEFLVGWLLPHGSVEIPAIILAGQAGFVIAGAVIGWGRRYSLRERMRRISGDLVTLIGGVAVFLVWAGIIEAYLSQYHQPTFPYSIKILFGCIQLFLVVVFLGWSGRKGERD